MNTSSAIDSLLLKHKECDFSKLNLHDYSKQYAKQFAPYSLFQISDYAKNRIEQIKCSSSDYQLYEKCRAVSWQALYVSVFIFEE